ncbi:dipeptidase [Phytoactinopolyspora endophytica]|uniref:dipeptidase n=1 Tax=Phytoactinopolyspora endophytica TaxID=1642495 RepID=UPI0013EC009B|nr:membrane dipeptidase [Phytoactinopolyspora endophytica]
MPHQSVTIDGCNPSNWDSPDVFDHMIQGRVAAANATIAIWEGFSETVDETAKWHRRFRQDQAKVIHVRHADDIIKADQENKAGIVLGWQNISPIHNDFERLEAFQVLGVRIVQLAYNIRNLVANGCYEANDDGLSMFGVRTVKKLNELGILIDLSHVGDQSSVHAIDVSNQPVAFTHTNLREFFDHPRNKPADLIRALVSGGGVVGANAYPQFLPSGYEADLREYLDGVERLIEIAGIDHVGIATDSCEGHDWDFWRYLGRLHGTTPHFEIDLPRPNPVIKGLAGTFDIPNVAEGLRSRGYNEDDVAKVMGGNWLRLYQTVWAV